MQKVKKYWARFYAPGSFVANEWDIESSSKIEPSSVEWPENAYAMTLHERTDMIDGDDTFTGQAEQIGPMYYHPDSVVETLDEAKRNPNATSILISNMECNRWESIVWSRWGNWPQPFDSSKHQVLSA